MRVPLVASHTPLIGIVGWKNSGKTTLVTGLVKELTGRGLSIATIKHAHHAFQIDDGDTDSARHRRAGAAQVAVVSPVRWAVVQELGTKPEPSLEDIIARLSPCDLIVVEGYKKAPIRKIEVRRSASLETRPLAESDPNVVAIAADHAVRKTPLPVFSIDDVRGLADFIVQLTSEGKPG
jgi:molybdopterin-guanine dinucleotide biosynthesis adapter protein